MLWRSSCCAAQGQDPSFQLTGWVCSPTRHGGTSSTGISTEGESDVSIRRKKTAIRWDEILATVEDGNWYLLVSPPCNAFSRARFHFQDWLGPRLLRNVVWPEGFPWLSQQHKHVVNEANWFVEQCILACKICHRAGGKFKLNTLKFCKGRRFGGFKRREASFRVAGVAFCDILTCVILCRKSLCVADTINLRRF
jgi:hypothetical protein